MSDIIKRLRRGSHYPHEEEAAAEIERLRGDVSAWAKECERHRHLLRRCRTILGNMALENEGAIFNRWPISHEPLRADARNILPEIERTLAEDAQNGRALEEKT